MKKHPYLLAAALAAPLFSSTHLAQAAPLANAARYVAPQATSQRDVFSNGITLVTRPDRTAPRVAFSIQVRAGAADETATNAGWRRLLAETMLRAVRQKTGSDAVWTRTQLQSHAETLGGRIGASVGDDMIEFWATGDSAHAVQLLDLLMAVLSRPRLSDSDLQAARETVAFGDESTTNIAARATSFLRSQLYRDARGGRLAYGLQTDGTGATTEKLTAEQLQELFRRFVVPSRFIVSVAGDADYARLRNRLSSLPRVAPGESTAPPLFQDLWGEPPYTVRQMRTNDAWVFVSYRVAGATGSDAPALRVLTALLGETPTSRLSRRFTTRAFSMNGALRASAVRGFGGSTLTPRRFGSELTLFVQTEPDSVDAAKNALLDEVRKLRDTPLSAAELSRAKAFVRGSWATEREDLRDRAFYAAQALSLNPVPQFRAGTEGISVPADTDWPARVEAVTVDDIQRVAKRYLTGYAVALVMPEE